MWTHYGDEFSTSDLTTKSRYLRFSPDRNIVMKAMRTWIILYNPPNFTDLTCKLYADVAGMPAGLIASSTTMWDKADLLTTQNYGAKEIYFDFSPTISLNETLYYHFVLSASNYTYADQSHLAWRKAWPDPIYGQATFNSLLRSHYMFSLVGADL